MKGAMCVLWAPPVTTSRDSVALAVIPVSSAMSHTDWKVHMQGGSLLRIFLVLENLSFWGETGGGGGIAATEEGRPERQGEWRWVVFSTSKTSFDF